MTDTQVRVLHGILRRLDIESPFSDVLRRQDDTENLRVQALDLAEQSRRRRRELAAALVDGERKLDHGLLAEYRETQLAFVSTAEQSVCDVLVQQAVDLARQATGAALHPVAAPLFERFRTEVAEVVDGIAGLPAPKGIWTAPQFERVLARDPEHAETLSKLALLSERFWQLQEGVKIVRDAAGFGFERFGDATRDALVWRRWERVLDGKHEMRAVHRQLRLWWATVEAGWEPGVWKPEDIGGPARLSFAEKLAKLGSAVTGGVARG